MDYIIANKHACDKLWIMTLTITEFARMGGKARWKGKTKEERSAYMKKLASKPRKTLSTGDDIKA